MFKKILVTTDLSSESAAAFPAAKNMAQALGASIELLAVVENPAQAALMYALDFPVLPGSEVIEQLIEKVKRDLQEIANKEFSGCNITTTVTEATGPIHLAIVDHSKKSGADLLIMSTHGRTGFTRLIIGSVAERVVRECPIPVLTVPSNQSVDHK